jgi:hypothetical protein
MGKFDFEDEDDYKQGDEPTFSLYDFKKWLSKQNKINKEEVKNETKKVRNEEEERAEFKERVKKRRKKKE